MKHVRFLVLLVVHFGTAAAQPLIHFDELKGAVNPYAVAFQSHLPSFLYNRNLTTRDVSFKPLTETFDYYDMNQAQWLPLYQFDYDYSADGQLNILNEYNFDQVLNYYLHSRRTTFGYDLFGFQQYLQEETYDASTGGLINNMLNEQLHTSAGGILQEKISYWNSMAATWTANHKHDYTYLPNGKEFSVTHADWLDSTLSWNTYSQYLSTYDSHDNLVLYAGYTWNSDSLWWQQETKDTMTYNAQDQLIHSESMIWSADNQEWLVYYGSDFEYDGSGNILQITNSIWGDTGFQKLNQYLYVFEDDKLTNIIFQIWDLSSASWLSYNMVSLFYGLAGYQDQKLLSTWNGTGWEATYRYLYTTDDYGNIIQAIGQTWNDQFHMWNNVERYIATWLEVLTPAIVINNRKIKMALFPDPASCYLYVTGLEAKNNYSAVISDAGGKVWMECNVYSGQPLLVDKLDNGTYLITIKENSRNDVAALPFIIAK